MDNQKKNKFNWIALLINGAAYYGGYGKVKKGILMAFLGFMPLTVFFVNLYAGFKANKELPVKQVPFHWGKAMLVFVCHMMILTVSSAVIKGYVADEMRSNANESYLLEQITGVWGENGEDGAVTIKLTGEKKILKLDSDGYSDVHEIQIDKVDENKNSINISTGPFRWEISQVFGADNTFHLKVDDGEDAYFLYYISDIPDELLSDVKNSSSESRYQSMTLDDLKLDINSLGGVKVKVRGKGQYILGSLSLSEYLADTNLIDVNIDGLDRNSRKKILKRCRIDYSCDLTVSGVVGITEEYGSMGIVAENVVFEND